MFSPSNIRSPKGGKLRVERVRRGLYSVANAYDGEYEFFRDRPIQIKDSASSGQEDETSSTETPPKGEVVDGV
jgi:hypothetical protein